MSFYFVDRIFEFKKGKFAKGIKNVTKSESFIYANESVGRFLNPAIVAEAVMQLASWLIVYSSDFTKKPVILRIDDCQFKNLVFPGDQIEMEVFADEIEEDLFLISAEAHCGNEKVVLSANNCHGLAMPIEEFDNPVVVRKQFDSIYRPEFKDVSRVDHSESLKIPTQSKCQFFAVDKIQKLHSDKKIQTLKQYSYSEDFFKDHFPRKPVVPGVLQLTSVGETAQILATHLNRDMVLIPKFIKDAKLRKFINPGSECLTSIELTKGDLTKSGQNVVFKGKIKCEDKIVTVMNLGFETFLPG